MNNTENQMKVLVIDDEPFVLKVHVRLLTNLGFTDVTPYESARDAMIALEAGGKSVGLILCDLQMPEMDGVEVVRYLVNSSYRGALVLVSGEDQRILQTAERLAKAHALNVLGALHKPASPQQLRQLLEGKLSGGAKSEAATPRAERKIYGADELRVAITDKELVNYYQPKVVLATGKVAGVETLVRWRHPKDGLVFPDQFIKTAEEHGLIDEVTQAVLAAALSQYRQWLSAGLDTHVAVNVSMHNLTTMDFPDFVAKLAAETGVPLSKLVLEVTESKLMSNPLASLDILTRLRLKGIGLSIDDFGTGHSSLAQLRDVPFSELKIDRGFVHGAWQDKALKAIFDASLSLARQLDIKTVAEGVEDRADWNFLRAAKCDLAQGYFIGRPMPGELVPEWISDWEDRDLAHSA